MDGGFEVVIEEFEVLSDVRPAYVYMLNMHQMRSDHVTSFSDVEQ